MHVVTFLQSLKDAMLVTSCGAEALPLISAFGVLPASVAFIMYYDRLVRGLCQPAETGLLKYWCHQHSVPSCMMC